MPHILFSEIDGTTDVTATLLHADGRQESIPAEVLEWFTFGGAAVPAWIIARLTGIGKLHPISHQLYGPLVDALHIYEAQVDEAMDKSGDDIAIGDVKMPSGTLSEPTVHEVV